MIKTNDKRQMQATEENYVACTMQEMYTLLTEPKKVASSV